METKNILESIISSIEGMTVQCDESTNSGYISGLNTARDFVNIELKKLEKLERTRLGKILRSRNRNGRRQRRRRGGTMKTTTLIKKLNQKEKILKLGTDYAQKFARCKVEEVADLFKHFSKQLDIVLKIK